MSELGKEMGFTHDPEAPRNALKTQKESETIKKLSSLDLVLAQGLNQVSLLYKTTLEPAEVRLWQKCFEGERAEILSWAFDEYFKTGTFPPKPADITELIRLKRESMHASQEYQKPSQSELERLAEDRKSFFASQEYKTFVKKFDSKRMEPGTTEGK